MQIAGCLLEGNFENLCSVDEDHADVFICRARFDRAHILPAVIGYGLIDVDAASLHGGAGFVRVFAALFNRTDFA